MGLAERRKIQEVKDTDYKAFVEKLTAICGFTPDIEFDWETLESHADFVWIMANEKHKDYFFDRVIAALSNVCVDDMGKSAVKESLKSIKMVNKEGSVEFKAGVLSIHTDPVGGSGGHTAKEIQAALESGL